MYWYRYGDNIIDGRLKLIDICHNIIDLSCILTKKSLSSCNCQLDVLPRIAQGLHLHMEILVVETYFLGVIKFDNCGQFFNLKGLHLSQSDCLNIHCCFQISLCSLNALVTGELFTLL